MDDDAWASLTAVLGARITDVGELSGGYVGTVYRVETADGRTLAAKVGDTPLSLEGRMLEYLGRESSLPAPAVHVASDDLLVMEYVEGDDEWTAATGRDVAEHVAALHECSAGAYGFPFETISGPFSHSGCCNDLPLRPHAVVRSMRNRLTATTISPTRGRIRGSNSSGRSQIGSASGSSNRTHRR